MDPVYILVSAGQLVLAVVFSSIVGYEREVHGHPAGLRTHVLVGVGATLFTLASIEIAGAPDQDPGRIAAQVVSGIGFLGAGTIIHQGNFVRGLTTAASLWATAGVGVAIGVGGRMILIATIATLVILVTLSIAKRVESFMEEHRGSRNLLVTVTKAKGALHPILEVLDEMGIEVHRTSLVSAPGDAGGAFSLRVHGVSTATSDEATDRLSSLEKVITVEWD